MSDFTDSDDITILDSIPCKFQKVIEIDSDDDSIFEEEIIILESRSTPRPTIPPNTTNVIQPSPISIPVDHRCLLFLFPLLLDVLTHFTSFSNLCSTA